MLWMRTGATDPFVREMADRHYPRQTRGSKFFTPPGRKLVLTLEQRERPAYWVTLFQQHVDHAWPGAWVCSAFRNESPHLSSTLIAQALAATRAAWGEPPAEGMITFVDAAATRARRGRTREPGYCFRVCGFVEEKKRTGRGLIVLRLPPAAFPAPAAALERQKTLF